MAHELVDPLMGRTEGRSYSRCNGSCTSYSVVAPGYLPCPRGGICLRFTHQDTAQSRCRTGRTLPRRAACPGMKGFY